LQPGGAGAGVGEQRNGGRFEIAEVDGSLEREPPDEPSRGA
jgi:hypothetical protein